MNFEKYGPWALVTGASRGLGKEFATQLADKGFNVVLASRKRPLLDALAIELEGKYNVMTRVIAGSHCGRITGPLLGTTVICINLTQQPR